MAAPSVASVGSKPYYIEGAHKRTVNDVTWADAYTDSGETITAAQLGLNRVEYATAHVHTGTATTAVNAASAGYSAGKLHVYDETPAELANASGDATGMVVRVVAYGY